MKTILTVGIVLILLLTSATAQVRVPVQRPEKDFVLTPEQEQKNIEICTQNLIAIGKSIQAYQKEHGDFPEWLSDLHHPKYMPDPSALICPSDKVGGKALFPPAVDPKMPVSYGYQFYPAYRKWKTEERLMFGDVVPLVRCQHHVNSEFDSLNLNFTFEIARSSNLWEAAPEQLYETPEKSIVVMEAGLQQQPNNLRLCYYVYPALTRLYIKVGREKEVDHLINRLKSAIPNDNLNYLTLGSMLEIMGRNEELLQIYKRREAQAPDDRSVLQKLAEIHKKLGNTELAKEYQQKAQPVLPLIGKPVPDFFATDLDGNSISLQDYRGKVVLLDFWAVWCIPCLEEMPNVKKVYANYKDKGFDIIGINLDDNEVKLRSYLKKNKILWRQVFSGKGPLSPIAQQYNLPGIPASWLIDRDGTLISHQARGDALEQLVAAAVKVKSVDEY